MFIEERLLDKVAYGTQSGVEYNTLVTTLRSGVEARKSQWLRPLDRFVVIYRTLMKDDREYVARVFRACRGRFAGFRFRDPLDYIAVDQPIGVGHGIPQQLQLTMTYQFGSLVEVRDVVKPVLGKVTISADGEPQPSAAVDYATGIVSLTVAPGAVITWSGEFDKPVRFDTDQLMWSYDDRAGRFGDQLASTDIPLTEYRIVT